MQHPPWLLVRLQNTECVNLGVDALLTGRLSAKASRHCGWQTVSCCNLSAKTQGNLSAIIRKGPQHAVHLRQHAQLSPAQQCWQRSGLLWTRFSCRSSAAKALLGFKKLGHYDTCLVVTR